MQINNKGAYPTYNNLITITMQIKHLNRFPSFKLNRDYEFATQLANAIQSEKDPNNTDTFSVSNGGRTVTVQTKEFHEFTYPDDTHAYRTILCAYGSLDVDPITMEINFITTATSCMVIFRIKSINP